jgi:hypothetical protein
VAVEVVVIGLAAIFFILAALALANWYDLTKDRAAALEEARYFVEKELVRVRLRFAGWLMLLLAMAERLVLPDVPERSLAILLTAVVAGAVFITEAIMGRLERREMLRGGELSQELSGIGHKLDAAATEQEDRFSEGELEKREVRERVDTAAAVSKGELDEVREELGAKIDEVIAMLRTREDGNG